MQPRYTYARAFPVAFTDPQGGATTIEYFSMQAGVTVTQTVASASQLVVRYWTLTSGGFVVTRLTFQIGPSNVAMPGWILQASANNNIFFMISYAMTAVNTSPVGPLVSSAANNNTFLR